MMFKIHVIFAVLLLSMTGHVFSMQNNEDNKREPSYEIFDISDDQREQDLDQIDALLEADTNGKKDTGQNYMKNSNTEMSEDRDLRQNDYYQIRDWMPKESNDQLYDDYGQYSDKKNIKNNGQNYDEGLNSVSQDRKPKDFNSVKSSTPSYFISNNYNGPTFTTQGNRPIVEGDVKYSLDGQKLDEFKGQICQQCDEDGQISSTTSKNNNKVTDSSTGDSDFYFKTSVSPISTTETQETQNNNNSATDGISSTEPSTNSWRQYEINSTTDLNSKQNNENYHISTSSVSSSNSKVGVSTTTQISETISQSSASRIAVSLPPIVHTHTSLPSRDATDASLKVVKPSIPTFYPSTKGSPNPSFPSLVPLFPVIRPSIHVLVPSPVLSFRHRHFGHGNIPRVPPGIRYNLPYPPTQGYFRRYPSPPGHLSMINSIKPPMRRHPGHIFRNRAPNRFRMSGHRRVLAPHTFPGPRPHGHNIFIHKNRHYGHHW